MLTDDVFGGLVGGSDLLMHEGLFGQCRVQGVDQHGQLLCLVLDTYHPQYEKVVSLPPHEVYLAGNGTMELVLPEDYD